MFSTDGEGDQSQNLLVNAEPGGGGREPAPPASEEDAHQIRMISAAVKRAMEPVLAEIQGVKRLVMLVI